MGHWGHPGWGRQRQERAPRGSGLSGGGGLLLDWAVGVAMWGHLAFREDSPGVLSWEEAEASLQPVKWAERRGLSGRGGG